MSDFDFDLDSMEGSKFGEVLNGTFTMEVIEAKRECTKAGDGTMLVLTWNIISGEREGQRIWERLNYHNPSASAVEIARRRIKDLATAMGIKGRLNDPESFLFKPINVRLYPTKKGDQGFGRVTPLDNEATEATAAKTNDPVPKSPSPLPSNRNGGSNAPWHEK